MAVETYGGSVLGKLGLSVLGKASAVSAVTLGLTLGTAVLVVAAGAALIAQMVDLETSGEKKQKADQS